MSMSQYNLIRQRIDQVKPEPIRYCLMTAYLYAGRICEVISQKVPSDLTTTPRGPRGTDVRLDTYEGEEIVVFTVYTAKREGIKRNVALPISYESWAKPLYEYFSLKGNDFVFPFNRQKVWAYSKKAFEGEIYEIEEYRVLKDGELKSVKRHPKPFRLHALRHLRASELVEYFGFDGFNLATYGGWKYSTTARTSSVMDRYLTLGWQSYIGKLFKKRRI